VADRSSQPSDKSGAAEQTSASELASLAIMALSPLPIYGLIVTVGPDGAVTIDGAVRTERDRRSAERAARVPGAQAVINQLIVDPQVGSLPLNRAVLSPELAAEIELNQLAVAPGTEIDLNERIGTTDTAVATDEAEPYFPPTDPPVRRASRQHEGIEVVGGFSPTSLDAPIDLEQLPRALLTGDDEIAREVRLALREDAATGDLAIRVIVRHGVVRLRGLVAGLGDVEAAEEVASRVPNVIEVIEELEVA